MWRFFYRDLRIIKANNSNLLNKWDKDHLCKDNHLCKVNHQCKVNQANRDPQVCKDLQLGNLVSIQISDLQVNQVSLVRDNNPAECAQVLTLKQVTCLVAVKILYNKVRDEYLENRFAKKLEAFKTKSS